MTSRPTLGTRDARNCAGDLTKVAHRERETCDARGLFHKLVGLDDIAFGDQLIALTCIMMQCRHLTE